MSDTIEVSSRTRVSYNYPAVDIDKDIPIPPREYKPHVLKAKAEKPPRPYGVRWAEMEVGDSVFLAGFLTKAAPPGTGPRFSAGSVKRLWGGTWLSRAFEEHGIPGVRVWRIA